MKKGKRVDVTRSLVHDPNSLPAPESREQKAVCTAWRPDKLREMTYTQFWQLISERQIDRVRARCGLSQRLVFALRHTFGI